ncbi:unnamed protein product [Thlaspi arvense]|uniref:FBD domain-containing protein n=1 Tax=Thlaspi arvense TaxID=13288 RepID=A0AAU9SIF3_THLAR|nr:unnamed protein product [Thlaspi arvense]
MAEKRQISRMGKLPSELHLKILSSLPTKLAVTTSVLSKPWRSLWKFMTGVKFDFEVHPTFPANVYKSLLQNKASPLESLDLNVRGAVTASNVSLWCGTAFARGLRELVLQLSCCISLHFPTQVALLALHKLRLHRVDFEDETSVLEDVVLDRSLNLDNGNFPISVPSLQRLAIRGKYGEESAGGYTIDAPCLAYLHIEDWGLLAKFFRFAQAPTSLLEATITCYSYKPIPDDNILESLTSARRIASLVSPLKLKHPPAGKFFEHLLSLELASTDQTEWWILLFMMLDASPILQILKLVELMQVGDSPEDQRWIRPDHVPECLLKHLQTFTWSGFNQIRDDGEDVAGYLLWEARVLKKATFLTFGSPMSYLRHDLTSVVRESCEIVVEEQSV